jgi:hypothetical protein
MLKAVLVILLQVACSTGFSQHLSFKFGTPFRRPDLDVRWNVATNDLPKNVWIYRLSGKIFPPASVSNLIAIGRFSARDCVRSNADEMQFTRPDRSSLWISFRLGAIEYYPLYWYGPTNLAKDVPGTAELPSLASAFIKEVGINSEEIDKRKDGSPAFSFSEPTTMYFVNHVFITNVEYRAVSFRRAIDGGRWTGNGTGGDCEVRFGERGEIARVRLSWRNLSRYRSYAPAPPERITTWIRTGKAVQNMLPMDAQPIDWKAVRVVTVNTARLCYYAGSPFDPSSWLIPFVALWTTVDTGHGTIEVEIDCPIIDESKPGKAH